MEITKKFVYQKTGAEHVGTVIDTKNDFDVILLDISMPGKNGLDILRELKNKRPKVPVLILSIYPEDQDRFEDLRRALERLRLVDSALFFEEESSGVLGRGFRCGFLGVLHSEIIAERLKREFGLELVLSRPSVEYQITDTRGREFLIKSAGDWPDPSQIQQIKEPWARIEVLTPQAAFSGTLQVLESVEGMQKNVRYLGDQTAVLVYEIPLRELIQNLHDRLKSASSGLASLEYETIAMRQADLVKLNVLVAGVKREELSRVVPASKAYQEGKTLVEKLKKLLPKQLFTVPLQAALGGKIIARETIGAKRRDVTAPLYGGDVTRKRKLLDRQKEGKKELAGKARIRIPASVFLEIFRNKRDHEDFAFANTEFICFYVITENFWSET